MTISHVEDVLQAIDGGANAHVVVVQAAGQAHAWHRLEAVVQRDCGERRHVRKQHPHSHSAVALCVGVHPLLRLLDAVRLECHLCPAPPCRVYSQLMQQDFSFIFLCSWMAHEGSYRRPILKSQFSAHTSIVQSTDVASVQHEQTVASMLHVP